MASQGGPCGFRLAPWRLTDSRADAQAIGRAVAEKPVSASDKEDANRPFRVVAQSTDNTEALQDFDRHRQRGKWERAFKALEKAKNSNPNARNCSGSAPACNVLCP